jgi:hypothetical protein
MAFRSYSSNNATTANPVLALPTGTASGDVLIMWYTAASGSVAVTWPSGFSQIQYETLTSSGSQTFAAAWKVATGAEPSTYTITVGANYQTCGVAAFSGRTNTQYPIVYTTNQTTGAASPVTVNPTTPLIPAGSDVMWLVDMFYGFGSTISAITPPSGFTTGAIVDCSQYAASAFAYENNAPSLIPAGSQLSGTMSVSGNPGGVGWGAFVIALPSSSYTPSGVALNGTTIGSTLVNSTVSPGGTVTFSYTTPAGTTCLALVETNDGHGIPSTITYNGVAMTLVPGTYYNQNYTYCSSNTGVYSYSIGNQQSIWYLINPPTGSSYTVSATYPGGTSVGGLVTIPLTGVDPNQPVVTLTQPLPTSTANSGSTASMSVPTPAGPPTGLAIGTGFFETYPAAVTSATNQTNIFNVSNRGSNQWVIDYAIPPLNSFSWTANTSAYWFATSALFLPATSTTKAYQSGKFVSLASSQLIESAAAPIKMYSNNTTQSTNFIEQTPTTSITFVNATSNNYTLGATNTNSVLLPSGVAAGDLILLTTSAPYGVVTTSVPSGFTQIAGIREEISIQSLSMFWKIATGSEPSSYTVTYTSTGDPSILFCTAYRGVNTASPIDQCSVRSYPDADHSNGFTLQGTDAAPFGPPGYILAQSITPTVNNCMVVFAGCASVLNYATTPAMPTGFTQRTVATQTNGGNLILGDIPWANVPTGDQYGFVTPNTYKTSSCGILVSLNPASVTTGPSMKMYSNSALQEISFLET